MDITEKILLFKNFLTLNWNIISTFFSKIENNEEHINNFIQGSWELLVETSLDLFLQPFGEGADINGLSSRITYIEEYPSTLVSCKIKKGADSLCLYTGEKQIDISGYYFEKFGNDDFKVAPPFDYVKLINENQERRVININSLSFYLCTPSHVPFN